jgi:hypothetical protein
MYGVSCASVRRKKKELFMKMSKVPVLILGAALLLSMSAFAREANKSTLQLSDKVTVEGKTLNPGRYTVQWNGNGSAAQVTLLQGKQTVATLPANLTEQAAPNTQDAYGTTVAPDGSRLLTVIYPSGKRLALQINQNGPSQQSSERPSR